MTSLAFHFLAPGETQRYALQSGGWGVVELVVLFQHAEQLREKGFWIRTGAPQSLNRTLLPPREWLTHAQQSFYFYTLKHSLETVQAGMSHFVAVIAIS